MHFVVSFMSVPKKKEKKNSSEKEKKETLVVAKVDSHGSELSYLFNDFNSYLNHK